MQLSNLMEESGSGLEKISELYKGYKEEYQPKVYSDPAQFIITLYDFNLPKIGNRVYDEEIIYIL